MHICVVFIDKTVLHQAVLPPNTAPHHPVLPPNTVPHHPMLPPNTVPHHPVLPPNKPKITQKKISDSYVNLQHSPISPGIKPHEEYIPAPTPQGINIYPMQSKATKPLNLQMPLKPTIVSAKPVTHIPPNTLLSSADSKLRSGEKDPKGLAKLLNSIDLYNNSSSTSESKTSSQPHGKSSSLPHMSSSAKTKCMDRKLPHPINQSILESGIQEFERKKTPSFNSEHVEKPRISHSSPVCTSNNKHINKNNGQLADSEKNTRPGKKSLILPYYRIKSNAG